MLPFDRNADGMHHMRFDTIVLQPVRQPEAVATGFVGKANAGDPATAAFLSLIAPAVQL